MLGTGIFYRAFPVRDPDDREDVIMYLYAIQVSASAEVEALSKLGCDHSVCLNLKSANYFNNLLCSTSYFCYLVYGLSSLVTTMAIW